MAKPLKKQTKPEATPKQDTSVLDDFLAKLAQHNIPEADAATTAKYYYNQPELSRMNATQLESLFQRLLSRVESDKPEAAVISITTEAQPITHNPQPSEEAASAVVVVEAPIEAAIEVSAAPELVEVVAAPEEIAAEVIVEAQAETTPEVVAPEIVTEPALAVAPEPAQEVALVEVAPVEVPAVVAPAQEAASTEAPIQVPAALVTPVQEAQPVVEVAPALEVAPVVESSIVAEAPKPEPQETRAQEAKAEEPQVEEPDEEEEPATPAIPEITEPRYWRKNGWSAKVIKNEDDDGWAIEIHKEGVSDPVLVSPWVMGRDKKNPKPIDSPSFATFVKTASEVIRRAEQQRERALKRMVSSCWDGIWYKIVLQIIPDEYDPYAILSASGPDGDIVKLKVAPNYKLTQATADKWVRGGFKEM